ncbi:MAG: PH domain-containing protein [Actinobacteria bacterium]|nr:PH domain-containing protein [Actinomycetota bacterium]
MAYPRDQLHEYEELILDLHPHWWFMSKAIFVLVLTVVFAIFSFVIGNSPLQLFAAILLLLALGWFLARFIKWATTDFVLTSDRVIYREGVIAKKGIEIPLERINTMFFQQGIFERIFGLGNLEIESASKDGAQVFDDIRKPSAVQNEIYRQMEINQNRRFDRVSNGISTAMQHPQPAPPYPQTPQSPNPYVDQPATPYDPTQVQGQPPSAPASPATPGQASIYDQIEQLSRLRDQGMISEAEYEAKKIELLGRM